MTDSAIQNGEISCKSDDVKEIDKLLLEPFTYLQQVEGKNVRKKLLQAFNVWLKVPTEKVEEIAKIIQMLHNASLIIDDIEDSSTLRRGIPASYKVFGQASTINAANFVMFIALKNILDLGHPDGARIYSEQLLELHRGQGMDIHWRDNYICPTEEEYRQMSVRKTGGLFNLAVRLMQLFSSEHDVSYIKLTNLFGLYFQIRDDFANLCLKEYSETKSFAEDLTEGKFSFPIVHAIRTHPESNVIINILRQRTTDVDVKKYCISQLEALGSFAYTKEVLEDLDSKIRVEIKRIGTNPFLLTLLDELKNWKNS